MNDKDIKAHRFARQQATDARRAQPCECGCPRADHVEVPGCQLCPCTGYVAQPDDRRRNEAQPAKPDPYLGSKIGCDCNAVGNDDHWYSCPLSRHGRERVTPPWVAADPTPALAVLEGENPMEVELPNACQTFAEGVSPTGHYRKKPVVIRAWRWFPGSRVPGVNAFGQVETLEGIMLANPGDWIITGVKGEHYPCKPDVFAATYEPVDLLKEAALRTCNDGGDRG